MERDVWNCSHNQCLYSGDLDWCIEEKCRSSLEFRGSDSGVFSMFPLSEQLLSGTEGLDVAVRINLISFFDIWNPWYQWNGSTLWHLFLQLL